MKERERCKMKPTEWIHQIFKHPYSKWSLTKARNSILTSDQFGERKEMEIINLLIQRIKAQPIQTRPYVFFDIGSNVGIYSEDQVEEIVKRLIENRPQQ